MPEDHTGVQLQDALSVTLEQWNFDLRKLTTDSGSNIFGHNLDLAISKGLNDSRIEWALSICRKVVAVFSSSWKKTERIEGNTGTEGFATKKVER